jgi:CRISPR-associated exonuclease Cas4
MEEEDYILLSGIHNFALCPRRFALCVVEDKWEDIWRTIDGANMHKKAHDAKLTEKRGDTIIMRALRVSSAKLCLAGECDIVEFKRDENGVELNGYAGKYIPFPIEYKRGKEPCSDCDRLQLCAQAICLEEMLLCNIPNGALFYGEPHRRYDVEFTDELKERVVASAKEMRKLLERGYTPKAVKGEFCDQCSLKNECIPEMNKRQSVREYIKKHSEEK